MRFDHTPARLRSLSQGILICLIVATLSSCGSYRNEQGDAEGDAMERRLNEIERKVDTQNSRFNQMMYGIEDSLAVWRESAQPGGGGTVKYRVAASDEIYFDLNDYTLDDGDKAILEQFARELARNPHGYLQISGHTDKTGGSYYNLQLSTQRAEAAVRYLIRQWDVPLSRMERIGYGEEDQAHPDDTSVNNNRNRRLNIQLMVPANDSGSGSNLP
ncbi:MAG: OmpA family protein [bacterium]|nr:OmpA family protein [bacterium]